MMKVILSWSSGKDSAWALHLLRQNPAVQVGALLTTFNETVDRVAMHGVRRSLVEAQAAAAGLPLWPVPIPSPCPNEIYEARMREAVSRAGAEGFTHAAFGDLFLEDIRRYREDRLAGSGLDPLFPVWGLETHALAGEMIASGVGAVLTCVDSRQVDRSFAGRRYDEALLADLPASADPCGERGEFHTFCYAGPMFSRPIPVTTGETVERDGFVFVDVGTGLSPTLKSQTMPKARPSPSLCRSVAPEIFFLALSSRSTTAYSPGGRSAAGWMRTVPRAIDCVVDRTMSCFRSLNTSQSDSRRDP